LTFIYLLISLISLFDISYKLTILTKNFLISAMSLQKNLQKIYKYTFFFIFSLFVVAPAAIGIAAYEAQASDSGGLNDGTDAGEDDPFSKVVCKVFKIMTGNGGKALAAIVIITVGMGFFTGKVSWGMMIGVAGGIAAMFGAPAIVAAISGESAYDCGEWV